MPLNRHILEKLDQTETGLLKLLAAEVKKVFSVVVNVEVHLQQLLTVPMSAFTDCYTAMIGLAGNCNGMLYMHIPAALAKYLCASMLATSRDCVSDYDICDALGELVNMIGGSYKGGIALGGHESHLSIPSIVHGKEYMITSCSVPDTSSLLFAIEDEWMIVSVQLETGVAEGS